MLQPPSLADFLNSSEAPGVPIAPRPERRSSVLGAVIICACLVPVAVWGQAKPVAQQPVAPSSATLGQWAAPVNFCTYPCMVGADAAVLNTGKVLFYYYPAASAQNSQAMLLDPTTGNVTDVSLPVPQDIFCSCL